MDELRESVKEWLRLAKGDLDLASIGFESGILPELLCFHAQQCAEKSLKAYLVSLKIAFPKTHNIAILTELIPGYDKLPIEIRSSAILTDYAVTTRYPGIYEEISEEEYKHSLKISGAVYQWVKEKISND